MRSAIQFLVSPSRLPKITHYNDWNNLAKTFGIDNHQGISLKFSLGSTINEYLSLKMNDQIKKDLPPDDAMPLLDYLIVLARHSRMIIYTTVAATVLAYLVLFLLPNKYTATTQIMPPQGNLTLSGQLLEALGGGFVTKERVSGFGTLGSLLGLKSPADLYIGMLTGNTIFDRIIDRFKLRKVYRKDYIEDTRKKLGKRADIKVEKSGLISIEVTDKSRERATKMANAFVEELNALLLRMNRKEATETLAFLEKERDQSLLRLAKAEESLRAFSEQSSVLQIDAQTRGVLEYIATLRASVDSKEVQLQVLRQQATPLNYDLIKLETEIKGLKEKLQAVEAKESKNLYGQSVIATSRVPALGLEYLRLFREAKFQEALYELYCKLVELARLDQVRSVDSVQVVDYAAPPERRSNMRALPALLVGISTFFIIIFIILLWEHFKAAKNEENDRRILILRDLSEVWFRVPKRLFTLLKRSGN